MRSGRGPWKQALLTHQCHFCHQHPCQQAQIRGPSPYHLATTTLLLQPFPPVDEIYDTFGKENKWMSPGQLVKSTAEKTRIKLLVRVCAKDWEFLGYSRPFRRRKNNSVCVGSGAWYWMCFFIVFYQNTPTKDLFLSSLPCFFQSSCTALTKENTLMLSYLRRKIWIKCLTSYQEQKLCFFNAMLSWPFQGEQQLASPS